MPSTYDEHLPKKYAWHLCLALVLGTLIKKMFLVMAGFEKTNN
jgi:hypothetical protein